MPKARQPGGIISSNYDGTKVPDAPTLDSATAGDEEVEVAFTAPADEGGSAITGYGAVAVDGSGNSISNTGSSSPITVTGLTNGTSYTAKVWAINAFGPSGYSGASGSFSPAQPRGLFAGGTETTSSNVIDYINLSSTGNASNFGDLTTYLEQMASGVCASSTRGIFAGGYKAVAPEEVVNTIQYVTIASTGNASDFGDLAAVNYVPASASSSTRGLIAGGDVGNVIQYITIASTGNATDFGDLTASNKFQSGCASPTRAVFGGGGAGATLKNIIEYVTIASTGNATDFGDLTQARPALASCSSSTRGLFAGGDLDGSYSNVIDYITIASAGNAIDFGDLAQNTANLAGAGSSTRATFGGGYISDRTNIISYVTIASTGNATDFGDLTRARWKLSSSSNVHGGLS